ncbi:hypothetical protein EPA93_33500 [Ktedonosporobacter rubrisoli]|uniref:Uncharacterized protein n=1 Tax=Ktedonosporobacter rubrisoli TaxID=2509675 RepID=A0A4P6JXX4_KTERU|nr:hypothetical protein [Ktedonosporobacter rubrisoli]QBD80627.1 hypothetical protein EPA93_33500 [Ktedonosporobacter rubrisoli]
MNGQLEKSRKPGFNYIKWGLILMGASVVFFILGLLYLNLFYIPAHQGASQDLPAILVLSNPIMIEIIIFILGAILGIIGLFKRRSAKSG